MNRLDRRVAELENPKGPDKPTRIILINPDEPGSEEQALEEEANAGPDEKVLVIKLLSWRTKQ